MAKFIPRDVLINNPDIEKHLSSALTTLTEWLIRITKNKKDGGRPLSAQDADLLLSVEPVFNPFLKEIGRLQLLSSWDKKYVTEFVSYYRSLLRVMRELPSIEVTQLEAPAAALAYLNDPSDSARDRLSRALWAINSPLADDFTPDEVDVSKQKDHVTRSKRAARHLTGGKREHIFPDEAKEILNRAKEDPEVEKTYDLYKEHNLRAKHIHDAAVRSLIKAEGWKPVSIPKAYKALKEQGVSKIFLPRWKKGYVGLHNGKISLFTKAGRAIYGMPGYGFTIIDNPDYSLEKDNTFVMKAEHDSFVSKDIKYYTHDYKTKSTNSKFDSVKEHVDNPTKFFKRWVSDLTKEWNNYGERSYDEVRLLSALLAVLVYHTGARIGSESGSTDGMKTFGLSSIRRSHVKRVTDTSITIQYPGKKGMVQKHIIRRNDRGMKVPFDVLHNWVISAESKSDKVFVTYPDRGRAKAVTGNHVNRYVRASGFPSTIHKVRHLRGTHLLKTIADKPAFKPSKKSLALPSLQKEAETFMKKKLEKVGDLLGHQRATGEAVWSTAAKSYVSPEYMSRWFESKGVRTPKWVPKV